MNIPQINIRKIGKMSTYNRSDLETLKFQPIMPKTSPDIGVWMSLKILGAFWARLLDPPFWDTLEPQPCVDLIQVALPNSVPYPK
jgi:hypothetical protein